MSQHAPIPPPPAHARSPRLLSRLMLAVTVLLGIYIGWQESPREVGRWYLAAAAEHRLNADYYRVTGRSEQAEAEQSLAEGALAQAIQWYPDGGEIYLERAKWRKAESKYAESLADCETALRFGVPGHIVAQVKIDLLVHVGKPSEAVKQAKILLDQAQWTLDPDDNIYSLNGVAYFRALADEDLPQALQEVDAALGKLPANRRRSTILDTRGYVLHRMGRDKEAMEVFATALALAKFDVADLRAGRLSRYYHDYRDFAVENPQNVQQMGVVYYHASRVLEKLDRWKEAKALRAKAKELLGREPDDSVF